MQRKRSFSHPEIGEYTVTKTSRAKRITLRIDKSGVPNVTIPLSLPYLAARSFFNAHTDWVNDRAVEQTSWEPGYMYELYDGTTVEIIKTSGRNSTTKMTGALKLRLNMEDTSKASLYATKAIHGFLMRDSESMVSPLVHELSSAMNVEPSEIRYRATTSRWGSCSSKRVLTFSVFIAQLPIDCIKYVVVHELAHLREMNHSRDFWDIVTEYDPQYKKHRKELKEYSLRAETKRVAM